MYLDTPGGGDCSLAVGHREGIWPSRSASIGTIGRGLYLDTPGGGECSLTIGRLEGKSASASEMRGV